MTWNLRGLDAFLPAEDAPHRATLLLFCPANRLCPNHRGLCRNIFAHFPVEWAPRSLEKPLVRANVANGTLELAYLRYVFFKVAQGDQGWAALWISTALNSWPQPTLNCIGISTNTKNSGKKYVRWNNPPFFIYKTLTCCSLHWFQASFRISPLRQLPATNTQIETHYLKSIALKDSFQKARVGEQPVVSCRFPMSFTTTTVPRFYDNSCS